MTPPTVLLDLAEQFEILHLRCNLILQADGVLPAFKGSLWHGWLGHAIKGLDEPLYQLLYGSHAEQQPKPYLIKAGADHKQQWRAGEMLEFDIILLGSACQLGQRLVSALLSGQRLGLGTNRIPFRIQSLTSVLPMRQTPGLHVARLIDWLMPMDVGLDCEIALQLHSPLRLKQNGNIIKSATPALPELIKQISRRMALLTLFWVNEDPCLQAALFKTLPILGDYQSDGSHVWFEDWQRFSTRQHEQLPFGGLKGQLCYRGDLSAAIPWLQLGELLHMGGKTTFGLGQYRLIY
ncbi:CRISPR system precrRNA processing endoribonuclease RAMP protein Cas6 [Shewanella baltica]|uniref:CRISPR system precrRNA processing endoribonuclease RAMP protein Cas6 n=1 Tax=Shewanella baltica TaxID=62322 RepID=UPI000E033811|nr:CRISPR system precrRNA processing endoribonuclease RAMP protein Cas6 [Shewanella baltica]SUI56587.1 Uncharacterized conserved protein (DUF2276) [Shewanella baltica]